ncbi:MAG TPA: NAD-glutamate dehydrogenase, partial [Legionellales bacterium]|nr:NAD-glutamate dehydrogenase [Legionellales bacterium]
VNELERTGKIDRAVEFIPNEKAMLERKLSGAGLTAPTIAVLLCYSKMIVKEQLLATNVPEDAYLKTLLIHYFPKPLQERFSQEMQHHKLKREIIATKLSNILVNEMGFAFAFRMEDETGAPISAIARAYMIARRVLDIDKVWQELEAIEQSISGEQQADIIMMYVRLLRRVTRWFLRNQRLKLNIGKTIKLYTPGVVELKKVIPAIFSEGNHAHYDGYLKQYLDLGITAALAHELAMSHFLFSALDIVDVAYKLDISVTDVAKVYFSIGEFLDLPWIRSQVIAHTTENNWESLSREALRDDLDLQQRQLTAAIINLDKNQQDYMTCFRKWSEHHAHLIERWRRILTDLRSASVLNYTMFFVAIRELLDLTQTTMQLSEKE